MVIAHVATVAERSSNLAQVINDILPQVSKLYVYLSKGYESVPAWLDLLRLKHDERIRPILPAYDKGDAGKFACHFEEGYHVTVDDDLFYPPDFVEKLVKGCQRYATPVSCHGRSFGSFPIESYYRSATETYRCLGEVKEDVAVQFPGTGVFCYHTSQIRFALNDFPQKNMADVWAGIKCHQQKVRVMCLAHKEGWIRHQPINGGSIWAEEHNNDQRQTEAVNEVFCQAS